MAKTNDFRSTGQLCQDLQQSHARIVAAAEKLRLTPAMRLNGAAYYSGPQVERIMAALRVGVTASR